MAEILRLSSMRDHKSGIFFNRFELNQLLSLYSRHVMSGEWRDYAIDHRAGEAVFSIFRHTAEHPLFAISKTYTTGKESNRDKGVYVVSRGPETLARASSITEALSIFDRRPHLISVTR